MGNRVSISFVQVYKFENGQTQRNCSVALFSHCRGMEMVDTANEYVRVLSNERKGKQLNPLDRLEPNTVMVDFIRYLTKGMKRVEHDLYLGKDDNDGDNYDNGHYWIELEAK